jgi:hypothetical protein
VSSLGRQVIELIDAGYVRGEWWLRYADRLTKQERDRIRAGDFGPIVRPLEPTWWPGKWLDAGPKLSVRVESVRFARRDTYKTTIGQVVDYRGGGRLTNRSLGEALHEGTTIVPISANPYEPEPEKVPAHIVRTLPSTLAAQERYANQNARDIERRLRRSLIDDLRRSDFDAVELEQLRAAMAAIRQAREVAA